MEFARIETVAECGHRTAAQRLQLEFTDLVGQRLPRHRDVAFDFDGRIGFADRRRLTHLRNRLFARPALGMQTGIDDKAVGAPDLGCKASKILVWIGVDTDIMTQRFGVETPAFDISGLATEATEGRQTSQFLLQRNLEVMPRNRFVQEDALGFG